MKRSLKTIALTAASVAATVTGSLPAEACDRGGRVRVSVSRGHYPSYQQPSYQQPSYRQPSYQPYCPPQVVSSSVALTQQTLQPISAVQPASALQPIPDGQRSSTLQPASTLQPSSTLQRATALQPASSVQQATASQAGGVSAGSAATLAANPNRQPAQRQNEGPQQVKLQPQSKATPAASEASALQMLVSISGNASAATPTASQIPSFSPASAAVEADHVGTWKVSLPGNQSVELILNNDNSFRWTATRNGNASTFDGQYRLEDNRLTLVRSNDLQQMAGAWSGGGDSFTFKLDGATTSGLAFQRN